MGVPAPELEQFDMVVCATPFALVLHDPSKKQWLVMIHPCCRDEDYNRIVLPTVPQRAYMTDYGSICDFDYMLFCEDGK